MSRNKKTIYQFPASWEAIEKNPILHPQALALLEGLRASRSKHSDIEPHRIHWFYSFEASDQVPKDSTPESLFQWTGEIALTARIGRWQSQATLGIFPPELVALLQLRPKRQLDPTLPRFQTFIDQEEGEVWEVLGCYQRERKGAAIGPRRWLAMRLNEFPDQHLPHIFVLDTTVGVLHWEGALVLKAWQDFQKTVVGDTFLYRNLTFRKLPLNLDTLEDALLFQGNGPIQKVDGF